jgi:PKD repeat protein
VNIGYNEVCLGDSNLFYDLSSGSVTDRLWRFDGVDSSNQINPKYLFLTPGVHEVTLTVVTNLGCTSTDTVSFTVHDNPHAAFTYINACTDFATIFTSNTTVDSLAFVNVYEWTFGDPGDPYNTSGLQNPTHIYDSSVAGPHNVTLLVIDNFGCRDSILQTLDVNYSVIPRFTYSPTCLGDIMSFTNFSGNINLDSAWTWNFGDQQTINIENPAHYYVYAGTYTVTLTALSVDGCLSTASKDVEVSAIPVADFASPPACIDNPYQFLDNSTVSNGSIDSWEWTFDTLGTDTVQNPVFTFDTTGTFSVNLVVYSAIGCVDSVRKNVTVHQLPVPNFSYYPQYGNPPLPVGFTNLTDISSTYSWDFGDGSQGSNAAAPNHVYQDTGRFVIELIATSSFGCVDSITKGIYVIQPLLDAAVTNVSAVFNNGQLNIHANIANLGTVDIDSVIMQARLQDGTVIQETYHQLLPNGSNGIQSYNFVASFTIASSSSVPFYCVSVIKPNGKDDDVESNNEKCSSLSNEFAIMEPYPNPFNNTLQMNVILPYDDYLTVELYNTLGQKISTLYDGPGKTGLNAIEEDFSSLADGVYMVRYSFRDEDIVRRVIRQSKKK